MTFHKALLNIQDMNSTVASSFWVFLKHLFGIIITVYSFCLTNTTQFVERNPYLIHIFNPYYILNVLRAW